MPYYCTVPRCTSMAGKAKNVSFHQFPRDEELAKLWNKILKRGKPYTKYSKVCSLHFRPEDYTITSVGKNRGQWRTLRKDAIPTQNLPTEIPAPYHRSSKSMGAWVPSNMPPNILDPQIHQQMAQAIYMQTMLAMQAHSGAPDTIVSLRNGIDTPADLSPHASTDDSNHERTSYKCTECSRCFKDPDVFKLHQRIHTKNSEKENLNSNTEARDETLKSNPILANLLKNEGNINIDTNISILGIENQLMAALAANMESYIRNLMLNQKCENQQTQDSRDEDSSENQDSCDVADSRDIRNSCENQDSCDVEDSRGIRNSCENQDSCNVEDSRGITDSYDQDLSDTESRDLNESTDSNVLVIDENAQRDS